MAAVDPVQQARRQAYLLVLPVAAIVSAITATFGVLTGRGTLGGAVAGLAAAAALLGFTYVVAARRIPLVRAERALVAFVVLGMAASVVVVAVTTGSSGRLVELIRQAAWLPPIFAFVYLAFGARNGAWIATGLWAVTGAAAAVHLLPTHAHPAEEVVLLVEFLLVDGVILLLFAGIARVLRASERVASDMEHEATTDALTQVANRRQGERRLEEEVERAERYARPMAVVLFDVDLFKRVNDVLGHAAGDRVLRRLPALLEGDVRDSDLLIRWGGEEFLILTPELTLEDASRLAERLRVAIAGHDFGVGAPLTASFGVAALRPAESAADVVRRADQAMYAAKRAGRNAVFRSTGSDGEAIVEPVGSGDPTKSGDGWPAARSLAADGAAPILPDES